MTYIDAILNFVSKPFQWWITITPWEQAIRVRLGSRLKKLNAGFHFKVPFIDVFYIQTTRLRVISLPLQTMSTKDKVTITVTVALGYSITDIQELYRTLYQPEATIQNMVSGVIAEYISENELAYCIPAALEPYVSGKLKDIDKYGVKIEYFKVTGFMNVRTYRLIQDGSSWTNNAVDMEAKR
jgi:hypothetical protein